MTERVRIEETTVGYVPGVSVAVGNVFVRDYVDAAGRPGRGPTARLALRPDDAVLPESTELVWVGAEVQLGPSRWAVERVELESEGSANGYVVLRAIG